MSLPFSVEVCRRLESCFFNGQSVVLLIHADLKRLMLGELLEDQVDVARLGRLRNVGVTKLDWVSGQWQLDYFNSVTHLPARLITGNEH